MNRLRLIFLPAMFAVALFSVRPADGVSPAQSGPTFTRHIAPILFKHCAACHHPGGSGPFPLLTYEDARKRARQIAEVTASRYMPPWLPEPGEARFAGERRLSAAEVDLLRRWAAGGGVEGNPKDAPPAPRYDAGWQLGAPDLIVRMPEVYTLAAGGEDVFRNFVIPIPVNETRFVRAVEILPGNKQIVHHANLLVDRSGAARRRDAEDAGVGFGGMDVSLASESFEPDSHFLFWKPGTTPWVEPETMAWKLDRGTDLVINMHLQPSGKPEPIQPEIGLYFTDRAPTEFPMLLQLERDGALDIPPGTRNFTITDDFRLPVDVDLLGVYPHAHYIGKELTAWATLPDRTRRLLIRIKDWDINWQAVYRYQKPIRLPRGTVISMRYSYDNSAANPRNPNRPPRRVTSGNRSVDEMGHLWLQVLPRADSKVKTDEVGDRRLALQRALMEARLRKYPGDFTAHFNLGAALAAEKRMDAAIAQYRAALASNPESVIALNALGAAWQSIGKSDEAMALYERVLRRRPEDVDARYNLGNLLLARGRLDEATRHLLEVVRLAPEDAGAYNSLGSAFAMQDRAGEAVLAWERALRIRPQYPEAHENLGRLFAGRSNAERAVYHFEQAIKYGAASADLHNELGVLLGQQGKTTEASAQFERALQLDPQHKEAAENLRRTRKSRK